MTYCDNCDCFSCALRERRNPITKVGPQQQPPPPSLSQTNIPCPDCSSGPSLYELTKELAHCKVCDLIWEDQWNKGNIQPLGKLANTNWFGDERTHKLNLKCPNCCISGPWLEKISEKGSLYCNSCVFVFYSYEPSKEVAGDGTTLPPWEGTTLPPWWVPSM